MRFELIQGKQTFRFVTTVIKQKNSISLHTGKEVQQTDG